MSFTSFKDIFPVGVFALIIVDLDFPRNEAAVLKKVIVTLCRNAELSINSNAPVYGGDSACPPEPPLRCAMVSYYLLWSNRSREGDATAAEGEGGRHCMPWPKKSVEKNILKISTQPIVK